MNTHSVDTSARAATSCMVSMAFVQCFQATAAVSTSTHPAIASRIEISGGSRFHTFGGSPHGNRPYSTAASSEDSDEFMNLLMLALP